MRTPLLRLATLCFLVYGSLACRSTESGGSAASDPAFQFAFLVRGDAPSNRTDEERKATQAAHMANIQRLADEKKLLVAGPFGDGNPHPEARGIFLFDTADEATARAWTSSDPGVQQRVFAMELCSLRTPAIVRHAYELDLAMRADLKARGETPGFANTLRGYVMYFGQDAERSEHALAELRRQGRVVLGGPLAGSKRAKYLAVLDAETVDAAKELLGARAAECGEHELVAWWSTRALTGLVEAR